MPPQQLGEVDVTDPVAVSQHEGVGVAQVGLDAPDPRSGPAQETRLGEGDVPVFLSVGIMEHPPVTVGHMQGEIRNSAR